MFAIAARLSLRISAAALVSILLLLWVPTAAYPASDTEVSWGVKTASTEQGTGRDNFAYIVEAGQTIEDALVVTNQGTADLSLDVYAADGFTTDSGQLDVLPRAQDSELMGTWITTSTSTLTLTAGQSEEIPFTLTIPENATPGDYAGGILTSLRQPTQADGFTVDRRLGIRVQVRVSGDLSPQLSIEEFTVEYLPSLNPFAAGSTTVTYTVSNSGNTRLTATQQIHVSGPFGIAPVAITDIEPVPDLLPGDSWRVSVETDAVLPLFWLAAETSLSPANPAEFEDGTTPAVVTTTATTAAIPWTQTALLLVLVSIIVFAVRSRRRAQQREDRRLNDAVAAAVQAERERHTKTAPDEL